SEELYHALVLGIRDYAGKCGFKDALIGLSGGIDSAVTCVLAAEALGAEHVTGVAMPSMYSSPGSVADATALAANLGVRLYQISITGAYTALLRSLDEVFRDTEPGVA
ncbi:NAD+ synthase, partial [bacterium]|nr:NAD+ synthase [bacterium]